MAKKESNIQSNIRLAVAGKTNCRLFRINAGMGWTGDVTRNPDGSITIRNPRAFHGAPTGYPDLSGFTPVIVTPEMVGTTLAVFTAIEVKAQRGRKGEAQEKFISLAQDLGALAGFAKSPEDALRIIGSAGNTDTEGTESR